MAELKLRPLAQCRVPDMAHLRTSIQQDVRRCMRTLSAARCSMVAVIVGVGRSTLYRWANGEELPDPVQIETLRWVTSQVTRRVGT